MRFQNHSDGTLTSYKANGFGFFLTLSTNVSYVCMFGERYEIPQKERIALQLWTVIAKINDSITRYK